MGLKSFSSVGGLLLIIVGLTKAQEDSLRSALNAIDRRQKDLSEFPRYENDNLGEYGYSLDGPDDLAFLSSSDYNSDRELDKNPAFERLLLDYLEDDPYLDSGRADHDEDVKKRISSSFRERLEEDKERQLEELAQSFLAENDREETDNEDYSELIKELWEKYRNSPSLYNRPRVYMNSEMKKRTYYPRLGLDSIGLRKRNKYYDSDTLSDSPYLYNYNSRDDFFNKYQDEDDRDIDSNYYDWNKNKHYKRERKYDARQRTYNYPVKRFPVSKRSSSYEPPHTSEVNHEHKRSTSKKDAVVKTDPKVAKDLSKIFGTISTEKPTTVKPDKIKKDQTPKESKRKVKSAKSDKTKPANSKEEVSGMLSDKNDKPLQIKKKSINWSDYFGLDRRKKSDDELDNEWLMERYHKAIALTAKRNAEYPLQSFKNHDQPSKKESDGSTDAQKKENQTPEEVKISEMDAKLKNMEDTIIDDALKYTGAHEGTTDSQEIQEVKDRVISRLAAAYSLEKMRRALGEYKLSIAKERERLKQQHKTSDDYDISEDKRVSVPRKQAIDEDREKIPEGDNNIKCSQGDEDCEEQNYRTPSEVLEQTAFEECPRVQRACNEIATILGHYARIFETACNMHQMCLLCSNNSWFAPTRQCNVLFLTKAFELCDGKQECQKEARRSVKYLLDVNRSLRSEPLGECELACPDRR
ncbi:serine/threonine-protein kinase kinX [Asbolus verrucosus]|uniref:Serine/threonine-protein kinase kinX n=1 Tax=Asbolus verrucosus TaxID=1661398 RepID=A0A482VGQ8_ASBVE|nr:serine/threonine-protein kinase kinX [Asbolus verrucosus]